MLTIGWSAFKLRDYDTALLTLNSLVEDYPDFYNLEEAYFVLGQCHMNLKNYDAAIEQYSSIIEKTPKADDMSAAIELTKRELALQEQTVEELKTQLLVLESDLLDAIHLKSGNGVPDYVDNERGKIRQDRETLIERIVEERRLFETVASTIDEIKRRIEKAERQKNWRSYAEYGRGRALFLKGMAGE
ncbi:tetratricopeptide repeat protein [candidate division KSB1 bacterium]|nr:tetratricopeptide repeat protein [candidate division KSB1 bacterium]NIR71734.1 tetratricopeptide repeat protein [candidate division KSB1 bacterium]NIS26415.1 tetratricopeptide repeat protein [candidate division KSB1 bacterium]NIT73174.1 tetratricopeptide repeat protein [candidate division KSB1 bacterium]NIU27101.1 tetratricopeptide repeat protein [candidate division KSB1 bacterium]